MKLKRLFHFAILSVSLVSCGTNEQKPLTRDTSKVGDSTYAIDISEVKTVLPQAGNVALIESNCLPCHSLRYIEMQPELTYKEWEKTVDKMITVYGAPIKDSVKRQDIINYLYAIKGKKES